MIDLNQQRLFVRAALLWLLLLGQSCAAQVAGQESHTDNIISSLRAHNFDQALKLSESALEKAPRDYRIWTMRGMAFSGKGKNEAALDAFERALKLNPTYLAALEGAAQVSYQQGNAAAKAFIQRVLAQRPEDPTSHAMLGFIEYREKECTSAVFHFQKAADLLSRQPAALAAYGACLALLDHYDDAATILKQAMAAEPDSKPVRYNLALVEWKGSHPEDALATLQPATGDSPQDEQFLLLAADIYESENETEHAIALLRQAIVSNPKQDDAYLDLAYLSYDHDSPQVGIDILNAGLSQLPQDPRLYLVRGVLYAQLSKFAQATEDFETANRLDPNLSFTGAALGIVESQEHRSEEAVDAFRSAAKGHPKDALTQYLLAEELSQQPDPQSHDAEAIAAVQLAVQLDPAMIAARDLLATLYLRNGHIQDAIEQSRAALVTDPKDQQALYHLILALRKTDQKDQVPELLKKLMQLRTATQQEGAQKKRYKLDDVSSSTSGKE